MNHEQALGRYVAALVDELARAGVEHVVASPGSRSTPLALTLADRPRLRLWVHYDERSAAFFALGMAKATQRPVGLVCTSGTAAANYLPAVVEARLARVPLLVMTADRPPELRDVGAPQTIDQLRLYGEHVKWFADALLPEATTDALRYVRTLTDRAVATALADPAGPVHLNLPFREPLVPASSVEPDPTARPDGAPYVAVAAGPRAPDQRLVGDLADQLSGSPRPLIVGGPQNDSRLPEALVRLAAAVAAPVLADPLSGVRCGSHPRDYVVATYDALLRDDRFAAEPPDLVLRFGAMPTSKPALLYLQRHASSHQLVADGGAAWDEPTLLASRMLHVDGVLLCEALATRARAKPGARAWCRRWLDAECTARAVIEQTLNTIEEPFEGRAFAELARLLPDGATLFAGNSMPVRDLDTFWPASPRKVRFLSNRGANGIDGVVSSALGASAISDGPLVLAIGDLSFYHDLNGLLAASLHGLNATIVLLNNDGGGIFSFLPQAESGGQHFERLFGTPHGLDFRPAVEMYGGRHGCVATWRDFRDAVTDALDRPGLDVIELRTERQRNVELHRRIWAAVSTAL